MTTVRLEARLKFVNIPHRLQNFGYRRGSRKSEVTVTRNGLSPTRPWGDVRTAFEQACKRARIFDFRLHDPRHSCASRLTM